MSSADKCSILRSLAYAYTSLFEVMTPLYNCSSNCDDDIVNEAKLN